MSAAKPITIVGGGLAGLTLGLGLRRRDVPVTVFEASHYPRHRVCGEFISGLGQQVLERLGLKPNLEAAGCGAAVDTRFCFDNAPTPVRRLPEPALSISRYTLDALLAGEFRKAGGELRLHDRWQGDLTAEGIVRASGRRPKPIEHGWRWCGLKAHARNVALSASLEMHLFSHCYVGVSRLEQGRVNICGLFRLPSERHLQASQVRNLLRGEPGSSLHRTLENAEFDEDSVCSVAGISLVPAKASSSGECRIGDALTMIPPVTGNGMSMAFEAAEIALQPLHDYSTGGLPWQQARLRIARACDDRFSKRLAWAWCLQRMIFTPIFRRYALPLSLRSEWTWSNLFAKTRN